MNLRVTYQQAEAAINNRGVVKTPKTSEMEGFAKIINGFQPLIIVSKFSILDVCGNPATPLDGIYDINNFVVNVTWQIK